MPECFRHGHEQRPRGNWHNSITQPPDIFTHEPAASSTSADYRSDFENQSYQVKQWTEGGGWLRTKHEITEVTTITGQKDYYTNSLKADYDGQDQRGGQHQLPHQHQQHQGPAGGRATSRCQRRRRLAHLDRRLGALATAPRRSSTTTWTSTRRATRPASWSKAARTRSTCTPAATSASPRSRAASTKA